MLDLDHIKVVLFDFDDTLCIHTKRPQNTRSNVEYDASILRGENPWENDGIPSREMAAFIKMCVERNIHMGMISATGGSLSSRAKVEWVKSHYDVALNDYSVNHPARKVEELQSLAEYFHCERSEILLVDDLHSTLDAVASEGFLACSPMVIVEYCHMVQS